MTRPDPAAEFRPPFKPRPGLFYLCMGLFVAWLGILVYFFIATVKPHPELDPHRRAAAVSPESDSTGRESSTTRPGADGSPAAPR